MLHRLFYFTLLFSLNTLHAEEFTDPQFIDTSGMAKPKSRDDNGKEGDYDLPLLITNKLGIHSSYMPGLGDLGFSSKAAASLTSDVSDVISFGFQRLHHAFKPDTFLSRFILANVYYYTTLPIHVVNDMTRYQWAVASRYAAVGLDPCFWDIGVGTEKSIDHGQSVFGLWSAPFRTWYKSSFARTLSLKRYAPIIKRHAQKRFESENTLTHINTANTTEINALSEKVFTSDAPSVSANEYMQLTASVLRDDWNIARLAAGFNDQSDHARELQHKAYWNEAHYLDAAHYLRARAFLPVLGIFSALQKTAPTQPLTEQSDNLTLLEDAYAQKGVNLSAAKIATLSTLSMLCSASFYRTFRHVNWEYYDQGSPFFRAYEWRGIRIPDVVPYLNSDGMSYHLTTGYRISPTFAITVAAEYQFVGNSQFEGTLGIMKRFPGLLNLDLQANLLLSTEGLGGDTTISVSPWGAVSFDVGAAYYNNNTLHGKRQTLSLKNKDWDYEIFAKISLIY